MSSTIRCNFKSILFTDHADAYMHDETDQCWVTDVNEIITSSGKKVVCCALHQDKYIPLGNLPVKEQNKLLIKQSVLLSKLIGEWQEYNNERLKSSLNPKELLLPSIACGDFILDDVKFSGSVNFNDSTFHGSVSFKRNTFSDRIDFSNCSFLKGVDFFGTKFKSIAEFRDTKIYLNANFESTSFDQIAIFTGANLQYAIFNHSTFRNKAIFNDTELMVKFRHVKFQESIFTGAKFTSSTEFSNCVFQGDSTYVGVIFDSALDVTTCNYNGNVFFNKATFSGRCKFFETNFNNSANFNRVRYQSEVLYEKVKFCQYTKFNNAVFQDVVSFANTIFQKAPEFFGAELHEGTDFRGARFNDHITRSSPHAYRVLKLALAKLSDRQGEANFYAHEQKSIQSQADTPKSYKYLSYLYGLISDYGQSLVRPINCLIFITLFFFLIYLCFIFISTGSSDEVLEVFRFTIEQIVRPFGVWSSKLNNLDKTFILLDSYGQMIVRSIATIQSIFSLASIILFILAVRRKFKLS